MGKDMPGNRKADLGRSTFLSRLKRDQKGNVLAIVAASIVPLVGAVGGGVDLTRAYMAQARLSQACDAAALAGRKVMRDEHLSAGVVTAGTPTDQEIQRFLDYNFADGTFATDTIARTAVVAADGEMTINLTTAIPTQLLRVVGIQNLPVEAECSARRSGNNVDVVLVLDVTSSMSSSLDGSTRIEVLREATEGFVGIIDELRTDLEQQGLRVRIGIVPYNSTVNVGRQLAAECDAEHGGWENCIDATPSQFAHSPDHDMITVAGVPWYSYPHYNWLSSTTSTALARNTTSSTHIVDALRTRIREKGAVSYDLEQFIEAGLAEGTNALTASFDNPYAWRGCVEQRTTVQTINSTTALTPVPAGAWDVALNLPGDGGAPKYQPFFNIPSSVFFHTSSVGAARNNNNYGPPTSTQWDPASRGNLYRQRSSAYPNGLTYETRITDGYFEVNTSSSSSTQTDYQFSTYGRRGWGKAISSNSSAIVDSTYQADPTNTKGPNRDCPDPVVLLGSHDWDDLDTYVEGLAIAGGTSHEIGMFWGIQILDGTAPFIQASSYIADASYGPPRPVNRFIVFMSDGEIGAGATKYTGNAFEKRPTAYANHDGPFSGTATELYAEPRRRFRMLCELAKASGIEVSTVAFSTAVGATDRESLQLCATSTDHYYTANTATALNSAFANIANNIGYLRVSR